MIEFKKTEFKNFLSYGNTPTIWEFSPGNITRISGENGSGKSSCVVDVLYFGLFGRTYRKQKLENLVNWINKKNLVVKIWFDVNNKSYIIERGLKPALLRVWVLKGEEYELIPVSSSSKDYQKIIEEEILQMNESVFNQTVIKSMTKNLSFMNLPKLEKRQVVESILGIEVFSHMNILARDKLFEVKHEIDLKLEQIQSNKSLIFAEENNIKSLIEIKEKMDKEAQIKISDLKNEMIELDEKLKEYVLAEEKLQKYKIKRTSLEEKIDSIKKVIKKNKKERKNLETKLILLENKIELFESTCAGCPKIKEMKQDDSLIDLKEEIEKFNSLISVAQDEQADLSNRLDKVQKMLVNSTFVKNTILSTKKEIKRVGNEIAKSEEAKETIVIDKSNLRKLINQRNDLEVEYNNLTKKQKHLKILKTLLSDDGIKSFIIKRYLPHINKILNTYLQKFNTNILFYFDTEFNDVIGSRYKENSSYNCFSEGQKRRIDLSVLFTFIDFSQIKNRKSNCNVLILDEITTGVDLYGENILFDILKEISTKENKEIITVSHSGNIDPEKIDRLFEVKPENGFSTIKLIES
jgi:DNA repair exonuclease SbcCD ATPase subunit